MSGITPILQGVTPKFLSRPQSKLPQGATATAQIASQAFAQFPTGPANPLQPSTFRMDKSSSPPPIPIVFQVLQTDSSSSSSSSSSQVSVSSGNKISREEAIEKINSIINRCIKFKKECDKKISIKKKELRLKLSSLSNLLCRIKQSREKLGKTKHDAEWNRNLIIFADFSRRMNYLLKKNPSADSVYLLNTYNSSDIVKPAPRKKRKRTSFQSSSSSSDSISSDPLGPPPPKRKKTSSSSSSSSQVSSSSGNRSSGDRDIKNLNTRINEWIEFKNRCFNLKSIAKDQLDRLCKALDIIQENKKTVGYTSYSKDWNKKLGILRNFHEKLAEAFEKYPDATSLDLRKMFG